MSADCSQWEHLNLSSENIRQKVVSLSSSATTALQSQLVGCNTELVLAENRSCIYTSEERAESMECVVDEEG